MSWIVRPVFGVLAGCLIVVLLSACQLVDSREDLQPAVETAPDAGRLLGNPDEDFPRTLAGLRAFARGEALVWQDRPVLADVTVWMAPGGRWQRARLSYVAAEADRMLVVRTAPEQLRLERPRLEGLGLPELPEPAMTQIPSLPADVREPADLAQAAAAALEACDVSGAVRAVLYATGVPAAWDGSRWTPQPIWMATIVTAEGGVTVDPVSGTATQPLTCVDALLAEER